MTAADSGSKTPKKGKSEAVELNSFYSGGDREAKGHEVLSAARSTSVATTSLLLPLKLRCTGTNGVVRLPSLPTDPRDADAAIMGSGFVSLGDAPFYRGSVNTGDGDTALIFASDGQLELLRSCRLVYCTSAPLFGWCLRSVSYTHLTLPTNREV